MFTHWKQNRLRDNTNYDERCSNSLKLFPIAVLSFSKQEEIEISIARKDRVNLEFNCICNCKTFEFYIIQFSMKLITLIMKVY